MLKLIDIYKTFSAGTVNEKMVLKGLNLHIRQGDFITVIGGNGAGKSTLLNIISGVHPNDSGCVLLRDEGAQGEFVRKAPGVTDISRMPEHQRAAFLGRVFQDPMMGTAGELGIEENLAMAYRRGKSRGLRWGITGEEKSLYQGILKDLDLGLEDRLESKVGLLSGGQRQALTLLMATLQRPKLLLLDEHTAALDPKTASKVLDLTQKMVSDNKLTTLMITHNMNDAVRIGNRLIMMYDGQIIYDVSGKEKEELKTVDLLDKFAQASQGEFASDRMMLS